jgi:hypothetical protein
LINEMGAKGYRWLQSTGTAAYFERVVQK